MKDKFPKLTQGEAEFSIPFSLKDEADDVSPLITNGVATFISSPISDAYSKLPPKRSKVAPQRLTFTRKGEYEDQVVSLDVNLVKRGQVSMFSEDNEIQLSDSSHKIFICLLTNLRIYYETHEKDVEYLRVNITLSDVADFLGTKLSNSNRKEMRLARQRFFEEISEIRAVGRYSYYENGQEKIEEFETSIFDPSWTRTIVNGKVIGEGYRISNDFYYSLVRCHYYKQIPFTAFASSGKYGFSIILDLYTHSRENKGRQEIKTERLLSWLGLDTNPSAPSFGSHIKKPIIEQLRNSVGIALKSFKFVGATDGQELNLETCKNREWVESTLIWDQMITTETTRLLENKRKIETALALPKPKRKYTRRKKPSADQT